MWGAIISGILGLGQMGYGAYQKSKAKKWALSHPQPEYKTPSLYYDNLGLAEQQAQTGFTPETLNFLSQTMQQNQAQATNAVLQAGGGVNNVAQIYGNTNNSLRALGVEDEKLRLAKINQLYEARKDLAGQKMMEWKLNFFDKWKNEAAANAIKMGNANESINSGLNTTISAIGQGVNYASNQNKIPQQQDVGTPQLMDSNGTIDNQFFNVNSPSQVASPDYIQNNPVSIMPSQNQDYMYNAPTSFNQFFQ